jgi:acyl carrier protein
MEINDRIKEVLKRTFDIVEVSDNTSQKNCAKWDSLQHLNLVVELESEFNVDLEPEEIAKMIDLDTIIKVFAAKNIV